MAFRQALESLYPAFEADITGLRSEGFSDEAITRGLSTATDQLRSFGFSNEEVNNILTQTSLQEPRPGLQDRFFKSAGREATFGLFQPEIPESESFGETAADVSGSLLGFLVPLLITRGIGSPLLARAGLGAVRSAVGRGAIRGLTEGAIFTTLSETGHAIGRGEAPTATDAATNLAINMALFGAGEALVPLIRGARKLPLTQTEAEAVAAGAKIGDNLKLGEEALAREGVAAREGAEAFTARGPEFDITPGGAGEFAPARPFPGAAFDITPGGGGGRLPFATPISPLSPPQITAGAPGRVPSALGAGRGLIPLAESGLVRAGRQRPFAQPGRTGFQKSIEASRPPEIPAPILDLPFFPEKVRSRISLTELTELGVTPGQVSGIAADISTKLPGFGTEAIADSLAISRDMVKAEITLVRGVKAKPVKAKVKRGKAVAKSLSKHEKAAKTDPVLALEQKALIPRLREIAEQNGLKMVTKKGEMRIVGKVGRRKIDLPVVDPETALRDIFGFNRDPYAAVSLGEALSERELSNSVLAYERSVKTTTARPRVKGRQPKCPV